MLKQKQVIPTPAPPSPAIGDIHGLTKGSGARYNSGKVPYEYLPLRLVLNFLKNENKIYPKNPYKLWEEIIDKLSSWQSGDDQALIDCLSLALPDFTLQDFSEAAHVFKDVTTRKEKPYPLWNWLRGMPWTVPYGCALRHALAASHGIEFDEETKRPHKGHFICNMIMLLQYKETYPEGDDRPAQWLKDHEPD